MGLSLAFDMFSLRVRLIRRQRPQHPGTFRLEMEVVDQSLAGGLQRRAAPCSVHLFQSGQPRWLPWQTASLAASLEAARCCPAVCHFKGSKSLSCKLSERPPIARAFRENVQRSHLCPTTAYWLRRPPQNPTITSKSIPTWLT